MRSETCDILVIGSGIAGLSFALHCAERFPQRKVVVLTKVLPEESNTRYAQGGIAAVMDHLCDSFDRHIADTLTAGDGLCDPEIVEMVVKKAPAEMRELMERGVDFDRKGNEPELGREGGHTANRVLHCKDRTGEGISSVFLRHCRQTPNIELHENHFALKLVTEKNHCSGAWVSNGKEINCQRAHYVMLASGGAGQLYKLTSNPAVATGDGMALAKEAGAELRNMAFVQFHPTVLYMPDTQRPFLISEAVRGFGAVLRDHNGHEFMQRYDSRGSLATRDIVSRAIFREMEKSGQPHLWLDLRHLNADTFEQNFPTIAERLRQCAIDIRQDMVPVLPAAHYFCGGVATNEWAETSVTGLLACGETAYTGLHGANRLASNSLLEALVFARQAAERLSSDFKETFFGKTSPVAITTSHLDVDHLKLRLQNLMTRHVGIVRSEAGLRQAREEVLEMQSLLAGELADIPQRELKNLVQVALAVIDDSLTRQENRGGFFRSDI